jgi:hypothetical protein
VELSLQLGKPILSKGEHCLSVLIAYTVKEGTTSFYWADYGRLVIAYILQVYVYLQRS